MLSRRLMDWLTLLRREWERALFGGLICAGLMALVYGMMALAGSLQQQPAARVRNYTPPAALPASALAFASSDRAVPAVPPRNAFRSTYEPPETIRVVPVIPQQMAIAGPITVKPRPRLPAPKPKVTPIKPKPKPRPRLKPTLKPAPVASGPPPPAPTHQLRYNGYMRMASGAQRAWVTYLFDPDTGDPPRTKPHVLEQGKVIRGCEVIRFNEQSVVLKMGDEERVLHVGEELELMP
jgi:outer membrane biosynthesis protein TonB